jgi:3-deoxy-D-manno-octulosonate 8-phosphate phosphatase (KDO 8-P phosphatase)
MDFDKIKVICLDCDGVLTDNIYQVSSKGEITKSFHTRDFYAIQLAIKSGLKIVIITQSKDDCIFRKFDTFSKDLENHNIIILHQVENKKAAIDMRLEFAKLKWENVAYCGDAENDLECMKLAGITGCPSDAIDEVKKESHFISDKPGGKGAVYNFIKYILENKKVKYE